MLMIVDPQVDFISGSLPVKGAPEAMDALADYVTAHGADYSAIVVTRDSHPANHCSFKENGGIWPAHCIADSEGAKIWAPLDSALENKDVIILDKGDKENMEEYSIFANEASAAAIDKIIKANHIESIDICGLAGDICVAETMRDGKKIYGDGFFNLLPEYSPTIS